MSNWNTLTWNYHSLPQEGKFFLVRLVGEYNGGKFTPCIVEHRNGNIYDASGHQIRFPTNKRLEWAPIPE